MKTLAQIEPRTPISSLPYTITSSGSYYLTTNLTGVSGQNGIIVQADAVVIDLAGFSLIGGSGSQSGVAVTASQREIAIYNGIVKDWGATGISAGSAANCRIEHLLVSGNSGHGMVVGPESVVRGCVAAGNLGDGVQLTMGCLASGNNCASNGVGSANGGIHVVGNLNRVEENHLTLNNGFGVKVDGLENLIIKNSAKANTVSNYTILAGNDYGQILTSPGGNFTNSNPWANFSSQSIVGPGSCLDGIKEGSETDVDCGGACAPCGVGKACLVAADCTSRVCSGGLCQPPSCSDGVKNGVETDADCGGGTCSTCAVGKMCSVNSDCASGICTGGVCQAPTCSDGVRNGTESDVDCGGACPAKCADGKLCATASDCASGICTGGTCRTPTCSDAVKNGTETDVDCGGGACPKCANLKACSVPSDCLSGVCTGGICRVPTCTDTVMNGNETDLDCGGVCPKCASGKHCNVNADCVSNVCLGSKICQ